MNRLKKLDDWSAGYSITRRPGRPIAATLDFGGHIWKPFMPFNDIESAVDWMFKRASEIRESKVGGMSD